MAKKTAEERCGLLLVADDVDKLMELFEDENEKAQVNFAAVGRVLLGTMLHMARGYSRDEIKDLYGGLDKMESYMLREMIKRHDDYKDHYVKRCANMSRRRKVEVIDSDEDD